MLNLDWRAIADARVLELLERVRDRAPAYFPGIDATARIDVQARWQRVYSDVYRLRIVGDTRTSRDVILKIFAEAEIQYRAMVMAWPRFAQHPTLKMPRPLDYFPEGPAIVMEAVEGQSLQRRLPRVHWLERRTSSAERDCRFAGQWLKFYHGLGPLGEGHLAVGAKLEGFQEAVGKLADTGVGRQQGAMWADQLRVDGEELRSRLLPVSRVHGDFTIDNVLLDGPRAIGLDVWAIDTNVIYHDVASFLNSLLLLRLTRPLSWSFLSRLRSAFLHGYSGVESRDELAVTFLQRVGLVDVALEIRARRPSAFSRVLLNYLMVPAMRTLAASARRDS
jgi:hypothetical protein